MSKDFKFSPIPINPYAQDFQIPEIADETICLFPGVFTTKIGIAKHYTKGRLPEGYGYFMEIGPKTYHNDWMELAFRQPLAIWMLSIAIFMPLIGILYGVLSYLGRCGSPFASERPFQRKWRFVLYFVMFSTILYTLPGLYSGFIGITSVMATAIKTNSASGLEDFLESTIDQMNFLFRTNKQELGTQCKAKVTALSRNWCSKCREEEGEARPKINDVIVFFETFKKYHENRMKFTDTNYRDMMFLRDIQRQYMRIYADHFMHSNLTLDAWHQLSYSDRVENYLSPRMYYDYEEAMPHLKNLSSLGEKRIKEIQDEYNNVVNRSCDIITHYGESVDAAVSKYLNSLEDYGIAMVQMLRKIIDSGTLSSGFKPFRMPTMILIINLWVCFIMSSILITFMIGLVVGILGSRGPRDTFGFNKTTAANILTGVTIATCASYTVCAFAACVLYFWALVVQNGVCNIDAVSISNPGNVTILHSCVVPNTVYIQMLRSRMVRPLRFIEDIAENSTEEFYKEWDELSKTPPDTELKKQCISKAHECDDIWPGEQLVGFYSSLVPTVYAIENREYIKYPAVPPGHDYTEYEMYGRFYFPIRRCLLDMKPMFKNELKSNHSGETWDKWRDTFKNFTSDFETGLNGTLTKAEENAFNFTFYSNNDFRDRFVSEMTKKVNRLVRKYNTWAEGALKTEIGECGHLMNIFRTSMVRTCKCMVEPLNGGWTGIFWVMFCLPMLLVTAIALSNNLRKKSFDYTPLGYHYVPPPPNAPQ